MNVLITGASGFIGSHLAKHLHATGAGVRMLCHRTTCGDRLPSGVEIIQGDVRDEVAAKRATSRVDTVFHLAAKVHEVPTTANDDGEYESVNVWGTRNLLQGAIANGVRRFIFFSSVKAMGERTGSCEDETADPKPATAYGRSKLEAERLVMEYGSGHDLHVTCLRLPLVYGPGQKGNLTRMIAAVNRGWFPPLPEFGNRRSMVHIQNVVQAALLAAESPAAKGRCYIVTDARPYATRELYEIIMQVRGRRVPVWRVPTTVLHGLAQLGNLVEALIQRPIPFNTDAFRKLAESAWYSSGRITRELGYQPTLSLEEALPEMIAWNQSSAL